MAHQLLSPIKDTRIINTVPTNNYGAHTEIGFGENDQVADQYQRTLIQFDLSSIPANAPIAACEFSFVLTLDRCSVNRTYGIYRMKRAWTEGTGAGTASGNGATWNTYNGTNAWQTAGAFGADDCEQTPLATFAIDANTAVPTCITVDLAAVASTVADLDLGFGWMIKPTSEANDLWLIGSKEQADVRMRPYLWIVDSGVITVITSSQSWQAPLGVSEVLVEAWGGGGAGSDGGAVAAHGGGGGGGGAYAKGTVPITPGNSYSVTVGNATEASSFVGDGGAQVLAAGGQNGSTLNNSPGAGGLAANSVGDVTYNGGTGGAGSTTSSVYAGGGGASGSRVGHGFNGSQGTTSDPGWGGLAGPGAGAGGLGGGRTGAVFDPFPGQVPGGGGGGAQSNDNDIGAGARGQVILYYEPQLHVPSKFMYYQGMNR